MPMLFEPVKINTILLADRLVGSATWTGHAFVHPSGGHAHFANSASTATSGLAGCGR